MHSIHSMKFKIHGGFFIMVELFDTQFVDDGKGNTNFLITFNMNVLRDKVFPLLTASELKVWLTILSFTNLQGTCFSSQAKISEISNISKLL